MKKIIILLGLLVIIACQPGKPVISGSNFKGSKGLNFYFDQAAPPNEVFEGSKFPVRVIVENVGTSDVDNAAYSLSIEEQYVHFDKTTGAISLYGKSLERPYGDQTQVLLEGEVKKLGSQLEGLTTTLSFTLCYPYTTRAEINTCIDTKPLSKTKKLCIVKDQYLSGGQAAPISIVKISPRMVPSPSGKGVKPQYEITVKNLDNGEIIKSDSVRSYCLGNSIPKNDYNVITAEVYLHEEDSGEKLECTKKQLVLTDGTATFFCELKREIPSIEGTYPVPLIIKLNYGYAQTITKKVRIQSKD